MLLHHPSTTFNAARPHCSYAVLASTVLVEVVVQTGVGKSFDLLLHPCSSTEPTGAMLGLASPSIN